MVTVKINQKKSCKYLFIVNNKFSLPLVIWTFLTLCNLDVDVDLNKTLKKINFLSVFLLQKTIAIP